MNDDGKTYGPVKTLSGAIECKVTLDLAEATLYCDDALKEQVSMFKSGTLTAGIDEDEDDDAIFAELLGKTVDEETGFVVSNVNDVPIFVGFGHIVPKMVNGAKKYKVEFFPKMKFKPFIADAKTKGDNLEFTTPSVEATILKMVRETALPAAEKAGATNRKKHRELQTAVRKATMFLTGKWRLGKTQSLRHRKRGKHRARRLFCSIRSYRRVIVFGR